MTAHQDKDSTRHRQDDRKSPHDEETSAAPPTSGKERRERLDEETDEPLGDIDDVLEDNPQDFVRGYVQKNGQ